MNSARIVNKLLENDEDDFDLVDELNGIPDLPRRWVQKTEIWYDDEDVQFDQTASSPVYFNNSEALVGQVVSHLEREGACFTSQPLFEPGVYYTSMVTDARNGPEYPHHYADDACSSQFVWQLGNFTPEEEKAIFSMMYGGGTPL